MPKWRTPFLPHPTTDYFLCKRKAPAAQCSRGFCPENNQHVPGIPRRLLIKQRPTQTATMSANAQAIISTLAKVLFVPPVRAPKCIGSPMTFSLMNFWQHSTTCNAKSPAGVSLGEFLPALRVTRRASHRTRARKNERKTLFSCSVRTAFSCRVLHSVLGVGIECSIGLPVSLQTSAPDAI